MNLLTLTQFNYSIAIQIDPYYGTSGYGKPRIWQSILTGMAIPMGPQCQSFSVYDNKDLANFCL